MRGHAPRAVPSESVTTRESFLQAARYVGRARSDALTSVLDAALLGRGGGCCGGESAVGSPACSTSCVSLALVRGAVVLRDVAAAGGSPYQEWRSRAAVAVHPHAAG